MSMIMVKELLVGMRKELKITQTEMAKRMGVKQSTFWQLENNLSENTRISTLMRYAEAIGVNLEISATHPDLYRKRVLARSERKQNDK